MREVEEPITEQSIPSAVETARRVRAGEWSAQRVVRSALERAVSGPEGIWLHLDPEGALERAAAVDGAVARGQDPGPLAGVPVALKDNLCLQGMPLGCGSRLLEGFSPPGTAPAVRRLLGAGAIPLGKTNLDEFAMGSCGITGARGPSRHPEDPGRVAGGSSGGSAVAVAAGHVPLSLGSDTGGSVRLPAAFCGVAGLRPGYGSVSRRGLVAFASSLDQIGPLAREVGDLALALRVLSRPDPGDATCPGLPPEALRGGGPATPRGLRLGVVAQWAGDALEPGVARVLEDFLGRWEAGGGEWIPLDLPLLEHATACYHLIAAAEASANLARFDGMRYATPREPRGATFHRARAAWRGEAFGAEVQRRLLLGCAVLSRGYQDQWLGKAQRVRRRIQDCLLEALSGVEALVGATAPVVAPRLGALDRDAPARAHLDRCTAPASLAGLPALSFPGGRCPESGLPVGIQLVGPRGGDLRLLELAAAPGGDRIPVQGVE